MKNYKQKEYVRIINNTRNPDVKKMNEMIGKIFEVKTRCYSDNTVAVYITDKSDYFWFNTSDTQKVFINDINEGCIKDGYAIGEGDVIVRYDSIKFIAYDFHLNDNGRWILRTHVEDNEDDTYFSTMSDFFTVEPKYPTVTETIEIGGIKYLKSEVENALKGIKAVK